MCSSRGERLARLRAAIDALAARSGQPGAEVSPMGGPPGGLAADGRTSQRTGMSAPEATGVEPAAAASGKIAARFAAAAQTAAGAGEAGQAGDIDARLAELWQMLAQLDPELARRLPRYLA